MSELQQLLGEISHCPVVREIRLGNSTSSCACRQIVSVQTGADFQVPEPWSGQIDIAPLLFISSNPSIDEHEDYPYASWEFSKTADFFSNRFALASGWVKDGLYPRQIDGSWSKDWVRFWASARGRSREILQRKIEPGIDFALTEVVHCKSRREYGVSEARDECANRYLQRVISVSAAKLLIVYGKQAEGVVRRHFGPAMTALGHGLSLILIGDRPRMLVFLPHPNERGSKKTVESNVGTKGLTLIRAHVKGRDVVDEGD
ncbi:uracil-DNA glycosylase family protein [Granulicella aggregans]|uniref:uracil-DNA glycosylase family protein n=1 Tax=Granulicella aggregans TaxID=474949 RepID=UPI0021DF5D01|nr:uracil-DNA glycosylase family protein [Granulicella aggregans]